MKNRFVSVPAISGFDLWKLLKIPLVFREAENRVYSRA